MLRKIDKADINESIFSLERHMTTFCVKNENTRNKLTFQSKKGMDGWNIYFRNFAVRDKRFKFWSDKTDRGELIGTVTFEGRFEPAQQQEHWGLRCFTWLLKHLYSMPDFVTFMWTDRCGRCGRPLNDETSMQLGYGPVCVKKI